MSAPDITGFIEAQDNLRVATGGTVTFKVPQVPTWPEGTKINPDTGLPYDATILPATADFTTVVKTCGIIKKQASPLRPQPDTVSSPIGLESGMDIILDMAESDYADVEEAFEFAVETLDYKLVEAKPFSLGGTRYRWLIYGEQT